MSAARRVSTAVMLAMMLAAPAVAEEVCWYDVAPGVDWCAYGDGNLQEEIHWAVVDLTVPGTYLHVTRDEDGPVTTSQEAANLGSSVTLNGDWQSALYDGPHGLSVGNGWLFAGSHDWDSSINPPGDWSFLACDAKKQCRFNPPNLKEEWHWDELHVIGGNGARLVIDGVLQVPQYDSCTRPRSGVCLDVSGTVMTLFGAEGDNSCSSDTGWTPWDFAAFVFDHGCHDGLMLDGGGSTDLVIAGVHVTDRPPTQPEEVATHNHLSVLHSPLVDPACATMMNGRRCEGSLLITCQGGLHDPADCGFLGLPCEEGSGTAYCVSAPCTNGSNGDVCVNDHLMTRCQLGQVFPFDCSDLFGATCEDTPGGARCIMAGCDYGGDASWCDGDVLKTCTPDSSGDLEVSYLTQVPCAETGQLCLDGACADPVAEPDGTGDVGTDAVDADDFDPGPDPDTDVDPDTADSPDVIPDIPDPRDPDTAVPPDPGGPEDVLADAGALPAPTHDDPDSSGCDGCSSSGPAGGASLIVWLVLAFLGLRARRPQKRFVRAWQ